MTTTTNLLKTPRIGDSVFIGFATNGDGKMVKGGAEIPFDKVAAIYAETSTTKDGKTMHHVRTASGDAVAVIGCSKNYWHAVK